LFPYWLLFSIFAAGSLEFRRRAGPGSERNLLLLVAGLFAACLIGLRYRVGADWTNYEIIFETNRYVDFFGTFGRSDPAYALVNWIAHQLEFGIWFVNLICALLFAWGLVSFARRQPNPWLAVLVAIPYLVIVVAMGYTRQAVALGFVLAGLAALDRKSVFRFAIYIFCAVAFHKSAIIVLPIVALAAANQRIFWLPILLGLTLVLYDWFVADALDDMVSNYRTYQSEGAMIRVAMNLPPAILFLLFQRRFELTPQQRTLWRNFSLAAVFTLVALVVATGSTAVDRLALYLLPLQVFVLARLPHAFGRDGRPNAQVTLAVILYSALIQFVWLNFAVHAEFWIPYRFYPTVTAYEADL
jgi:hypothetical protein